MQCATGLRDPVRAQRRRLAERDIPTQAGTDRDLDAQFLASSRASAASSLSPGDTLPPGSSHSPASSGGRARCATSSARSEMSAPATTI